MKRLRITVEGKAYDVQVELLDEDNVESVPAPRQAAATRLATPAPVKVAAPSAKALPAYVGEGVVTSPLAAVVVSIDVSEGDAVEEGLKVITLEAMKMNTIISSPADGTVKTILASAGDGVEEGQALIEIA